MTTRVKRSFTLQNQRKVNLNTNWQNEEEEKKRELPLLVGDSGPMEIQEEEEIDPLDAFMEDVTAEVQELLYKDKKKKQHKTVKPQDLAYYEQDEADLEEEEEKPFEDTYVDDSILMLPKKMKKKEMVKVDHSKIQYEPFRKDFYIASPDITKMTEEEVEALRNKMGGIRIKGKNAPSPIQKWTQCGLNIKIMEVIKRLKYHRPTPVQCQAIPSIMSGRDVISVAKTGSGKTIAFLLPMFRHILDQRKLQGLDGPISIIMTPTRELATQIHHECSKFTKALGLNVICAYGGSPIKENIADLKRGAEIIVCTPGRMIDLLCCNSGRLTNLKRTTYVVLDEADRMFDMGFEPQVMAIMDNIRPDRQTVLFSATFPRQMEALARKILKNPLEIVVGGRSVVCNDVKQFVEVIEEDKKFVRLLEILGEWHEKKTQRILIFVDRQDAADTLLRDLMKRGYACMSLHGGKDQSDRDSTLADFKSGVSNILIATSVAARGLDVKQLNLVVNYECPNHMEDYVHRVGRTGRAGHSGTAYTFIAPTQERFAPDIVKALKASGAVIPPELQKMNDEFLVKVKAGASTNTGSGFGGKGLDRMEQEREIVKNIQKSSYADQIDGEKESEEEAVETEHKRKKEEKETVPEVVLTEDGRIEALAKAQEAIKTISERIHQHILATTGRDSKIAGPTTIRRKYAAEVEINDLPQAARTRITSRETLNYYQELYRCTITIRGSYVPPNKSCKDGDRRLHLYIEADNEYSLDRGKTEIKRAVAESMVGVERTGKFSVI